MHKKDTIVGLKFLDFCHSYIFRLDWFFFVERDDDFK